MFSKKIGIDLGTSNTVVFVPKKGIVINQPTVVAQALNDNSLLAIGSEAVDMIGRTPESVKARYPMSNGVIADYGVVVKMLKHHLRKALGWFHLAKPEVLITVPAGATSTEQKAVIDAAEAAGAQRVYLIESPVAAAIGAHIPIHEARGNLIIDIGGGTSEIAVISLGGIVAQQSVRVGGNKIDTAIKNYVRHAYGLNIGQKTAEDVKQVIGSAIPIRKDKKTTISGRDVIGGLPRTITIGTNELVQVHEEVIDMILVAIRNVLEKIPPELSSDIIDQGMVLTGGGALLNNIDQLFSKIINVPCIIAQDAQLCSSKGTGHALSNLKEYKRSFAKLS